MKTLDSLPADQASALRLLTGGKTYRAVADLLGLTAESVASTALAGLDSLAPDEAKSLTEMERSRVADVVLGQTGSDPLIQGSPAAGAYAARIRAAMGVQAATASTESTPPTKVMPAASKPPAPASSKAPVAPKPAGLTAATGDRRRGMFLLAGVTTAAVGIALLVSSPWDASNPSSTSSAASTTSTAATPAGGGWTIRDRFTLKPVAGGSGQALAGLGTKSNSAAILIAGNGLQAGSTIGIWLTGQGKAGLIGLGKVDAKGQFSGIGPLPKNVATATELVVTQEQATTGKKIPSAPGSVLLKSPFKVS